MTGKVGKKPKPPIHLILLIMEKVVHPYLYTVFFALEKDAAAKVAAKDVLFKKIKEVLFQQVMTSFSVMLLTLGNSH